MISEGEYNPSCFMCRKLANKEPAGVHKTSLCFHHIKDELDHLRARNAELEAKLAALVDKVDQAEKWLSGGGDKVHVSIMLKAAIAAAKVKGGE